MSRGHQVSSNCSCPRGTGSERGGRNENRCLANGTFDEKRTVKFPSVAAAEGRGECRVVVPPLYSMPAFRSLIVHSFKFRFEREAGRSGSCAQKCSNRLVTGSVVPEAVLTQPSAVLYPGKPVDGGDWMVWEREIAKSKGTISPTANRSFHSHSRKKESKFATDANLVSQSERLALLTPQEITPVKSHNTSQSRDGADDGRLLCSDGLKSGNYVARMSVCHSLAHFIIAHLCNSSELPTTFRSLAVGPWDFSHRRQNGQRDSSSSAYNS